MTKIALAVIAKNKEDIIERMLDSTKAVFDCYCLEDTGSKDKTIEVFQNWCKKNNVKYKVGKGRKYPTVKINGAEILADFGMARNNSFKIIPSDIDYAMWIDTDDVIEGVENLRALVEEMKEKDMDMGVLHYDYFRTESGMRPVEQYRERIINLRRKGQWIDPVHETYSIDDNKPVKVLQIQESTINVVHKRTVHEFNDTNRRNHWIMFNYFGHHRYEGTSLKVLNNIAYDHFEWGEYEKAIEFYLLAMRKAEEEKITDGEFIYSMRVKLAKSYLQTGQDDKAFATIFSVMDRQSVDVFNILAQIFVQKGHFEDAIFYADKTLRLGKPQTLLPINEFDYTVIPMEIKMVALLNLGRIEEGKQILNSLIQMTNDDRFIVRRNEVEKAELVNKTVVGIANLVQYYANTNQMDEVDKVRKAIPVDLKDHPTIRRLIDEVRYSYLKKTVKHNLGEKLTIDFYTGGHFEQWDGNSDVRTGIGGSEGMVIQMSRELAKLGHTVRVFCECKDIEVDGVNYIHHSKFNPLDEVDVLVISRQPQMTMKLLKAKKIYLWLHDTNYGPEIKPEMFYNADKVFVLSEAHRMILKINHAVEDDSIFYPTRNSINNKIEIPEVARNPKKIIYASSYDRGLINILNEWETIREKVKDAELHIYYGWNTFDAMMKMREGTPAGQQMKALKSQIVEKIAKLDGVIEHGRVSQEELYKAFASAGIWYYPTSFYEISCINAMTAQACGAFPVVSSFGALMETVKYGVKAQREQLQEGLIYMLENQNEEQRKEMMEWAKKKFDATTLASEWNTLFHTK